MMTIVYPVKNGLYVNLTNRCPCACEFCIRKNGAGAYGSDSLWLDHEPTRDEIKAALRAYDLAAYEEVVFCGYGEPTERLDEVVAIARFVKEINPSVRVRVNTNGLSDLIVGAPTAARFAENIDCVSISLNASSAEKYEALSHPKFGRASYEALLNFAQSVKAYVPEVVLTVVATASFTKEDRDAVTRIAAQIGVPLRVREYTP